MRALRLLAIVLAVPLVLAAGALLWLASSLPIESGRIAVPGLKAEARIERDPHGIVRIVAASDEDAAYALGYAHAQDRLFQMELQRRYGAGRLSELLGSATLAIDRTMRIFGFHRLAEQQYARLSPELRAVLDAYAAGVNAYLDERGRALPLEYYLLRFAPEKWTPADTLVYGKLMAIQLAANRRGELLRSRLAQRLTPQQLAQLYPDYPKDGAVALKDLAALPGPDEIYAGLPALGGASNNWVVDGAHSQSGKPVLADDPHLGFAAPGTWYLARIETPGRVVEGVTAPGAPFVIIGRNDRIAWGFTTTGGDVEDHFVERIDPADPSRYLTPDGSAPFETRDEVIAVRGEAPVRLTVRSTRHGVVTSELAGEGPKSVLALAATYLAPDDMTTQAVWDLAHARDWDGFNAALRNWHAPQQNIVYADVDGNIGFLAPARIPVRATGDGWMPNPGWSGEYDWNGWVPFDDLPRAFNPASGRVVTANNKIVPESYPWLIARDWDLPNRAQRIADLLDKEPKQSAEASAAIQADSYSIMAEQLVPLMLKAQPGNDRARAAMDRLKSWDFTMDRDKVEPLLFTAWLRELNRAVLGDELGELFEEYWDLRPQVMRNILTRERDWCADKLRGLGPDCEARLAEALDRALADLALHYGDDMATWSWGRAHPAVFNNQVFARVPVLRDLVALAIPSSGGYDTVNRGATFIRDPEHPFANVHGAGLRFVIDMAAPDKARWMIAPGQSGNPFSRHWGDLVAPWRDFAWLSLDEAAWRHTLVLAPR